MSSLKNIGVVLSLALILGGCGRETVIVQGPPAPPAPLPPTPTAAELEQAEVDSIIYEENLYRYNNLSAQLTKGLSCKLYKYANSGNISIASGLGALTLKLSYPYTGEFNHSTNNQADGLSFIPEPYRTMSLYTSEVYVDCQGFIVITQTERHVFEAFSDDNLILTVNGIKVVNDDTNHGVASTPSGDILSLKSGTIVSFRVQYRQYNGATVLQIMQNDAILKPMYLYH